MIHNACNMQNVLLVYSYTVDENLFFIINKLYLLIKKYKTWFIFPVWSLHLSVAQSWHKYCLPMLPRAAEIVP